MNPPSVETSSGRLRGVRRDGCDVFLAIPFAAPPTGALRFRPPQPPVPWGGVRSAAALGPDAPQPPSPLGFDPSGRPQSEDCLTLNVWTPAADTARRPVMVWIHGGGFSTGGAARPMYDGRALATHGDVVFVSINYRLGVLGLLAHPGFAEADATTHPALCLLDQIAALEWVQQNIAGFGGDPDQVTVFGESAGAASVALLSVSPRARGLFRRGIAQSASPEPISFEQGTEATRALLSALDLSGDDPHALQDIPVERLLAAQPAWAEIASRGRTAPRPSLDEQLLPQWPLAAASSGATQSIELIVGSNRDEATLFLMLDPRRNEFDGSRLVSRLARQLRGSEEAARHVISTYRAARSERAAPNAPWDIYVAIESDRRIRVPSLRFLERHAERGGAARAYCCTWGSPVAGLGACHGIEIPFCLGTLDTAPGMHDFAGTGPEAQRLMQTMRSSWLALVDDRSGEAAEGRKQLREGWPTYDAERRATLVFGAQSGVQEAPWEAERRVWDEVDPA